MSETSKSTMKKEEKEFKGNERTSCKMDTESSFQNKRLVQIQKTIKFEYYKNLRKFFSMLGVVGGIYLLNLIILLIQEDRGAKMPETAVSYSKEYLGMVNLVILIVGVTYAGSIIVEDFEELTGNILFPKITRDRLLIGRMTTRYIMAALNILIYYGLISITTNIEYENSLPIRFWESLAWAELYLFLVMSFTTLFSSFMKRTSTTVITSIMMILIVFQLVNSILMFVGVEMEPFFILTYYSNIILQSFDMPENRYQERTFGPPGTGGNGGGETYFQWITPSYTGALGGMITYSLVCLILAYVLFKRRQISST